MRSVEVEVVEIDLAEAGLDHARLEALARFVLADEEMSGTWAVTIALVDDERLRALHRQFMEIDEPTDVMTFPLDEGDARGGEIVISVDRAAEQGAEHGHPTAAEIDFLVVHGLLHLCGWDDLAPGARERMLTRQAELLAAFDQATARGRDE